MGDPLVSPEIAKEIEEMKKRVYALEQPKSSLDEPFVTEVCASWQGQANPGQTFGVFSSTPWTPMHDCVLTSVSINLSNTSADPIVFDVMRGAEVVATITLPANEASSIKDVDRVGFNPTTQLSFRLNSASDDSWGMMTIHAYIQSNTRTFFSGGLNFIVEQNEPPPPPVCGWSDSFFYNYGPIPTSGNFQWGFDSSGDPDHWSTVTPYPSVTPYLLPYVGLDSRARAFDDGLTYNVFRGIPTCDPDGTFVIRASTPSFGGSFSVGFVWDTDQIGLFVRKSGIFGWSTSWGASSGGTYETNLALTWNAPTQTITALRGAGNLISSTVSPGYSGPPAGVILNFIGFGADTSVCNGVSFSCDCL